MLDAPMYDPNKTYEENFKEGPFGAFTNSDTVSRSGKPKYNLLGNPVYLPLGIAAGPLVNSKFVLAAYQKGWDVPVYKTVRSGKYPCHPWPNVIPVKVDGNLTIAKSAKGLVQAADFSEPLAITNSFGVPSWDPDFWQPDMQKAVRGAGEGQVMIASFQGTNRGQGSDTFIEDFVTTAKLVVETGAKLTEVNFSCPNEGTCDLLCFDRARVGRIAGAIKNAIGNVPLFIKLAYFEDEAAFLQLVKELSSIVDGFSVINTIPSAICKEDGTQALPGEGRLVSGICGAPIKWAGIEMVKRLSTYRLENCLNFVILGSGGVINKDDFDEYRAAGADVVMSATGAMWNPKLAMQLAL